MTTTNQRAVEVLLRELASDCEVAYGVTEQSYRQFCDSGALGRMPNDTWAEHCQRRKQQIEQALATLRTPGWRPISEAPRDGRPIMVFNPNWSVKVGMAGWDAHENAWRVHGYGCVPSQPTLFQPLPPPPGEAE